MRKALLALVGTMFVAQAATAFDNGPHWRSTADGLKRTGFTDGAQRRVWIAGNLVDVWLNLANKLDEAGLENTPENRFIVRQSAKLKYFHYDLLPDAYAVEAYTAWLENATKAAIQRCPAQQSPLDCVADVLGITLHVVQDLYAHSTLANQDWYSWTGAQWGLIGEATYFSIPEEVRRSPLVNLQTGEPGVELFGLDGLDGTNGKVYLPGHGSHADACTADNPDSKLSGLEFYYQCGYNHDSITRPNFLRAHAMSVAATDEWAKKVRGWLANDTLWNQVKSYEPDFTESCFAKAIGTASGAGYWGHPYKQRSETVFGWLFTICNDEWEDEMWLPKVDDLLTLQGHPADWVKDKTMTFAKVNARPGDGVSGEDFLGTYDVNFDDQVGELKVATITNGRATGTFTPNFPKESFKVTAYVSGASFDFELRRQNEASKAKPSFAGHAYLATHGKKSMSGYITKTLFNGADGYTMDYGVPAGFTAARR